MRKKPLAERQTRLLFPSPATLEDYGQLDRYSFHEVTVDGFFDTEPSVLVSGVVAGLPFEARVTPEELRPLPTAYRKTQYRIYRLLFELEEKGPQRYPYIREFLGYTRRFRYGRWVTPDTMSLDYMLLQYTQKPSKKYPHSKPWMERSGERGSYVYSLTSAGREALAKLREEIAAAPLLLAK